MFHFEPGVAIWTLVSFAIVLFVIRKYVYPPVRKILETRKQSIDDNLKRAEQRLAEAEERAHELEEKMHGIRQEEERVLVEAREKARVLYSEQERKAIEDIRQMRKSREEDLRKLEAGFYERTQNEFTQLVMKTCERILRTGLTPELQQQVVEQRIAELERIERM